MTVVVNGAAQVSSYGVFFAGKGNAIAVTNTAVWGLQYNSAVDTSGASGYSTILRITPASLGTSAVRVKIAGASVYTNSATFPGQSMKFALYPVTSRASGVLTLGAAVIETGSVTPSAADGDYRPTDSAEAVISAAGDYVLGVVYASSPTSAVTNYHAPLLMKAV